MIETKTSQVLVKGEALAQKTYSLWGLFCGADPFVKCVMLVLVAASIFSWAVLFSKIRIFWPLYKTLSLFQKDLPMSVLISALKQSRSPFSQFIERASSLKEKGEALDIALNYGLHREMKPLERHIGFLATLSSSAPFVGLLGTVWGIMNSFQAIAISKNTSLAVVAPGIAEALFATALGLLAAIPAVIAYNKISKDVDRYTARLEDFSSEFSAIISRQLEGHT